jgi:hypothetical protein
LTSPSRPLTLSSTSGSWPLFLLKKPSMFCQQTNTTRGVIEKELDKNKKKVMCDSRFKKVAAWLSETRLCPKRLLLVSSHQVSRPEPLLSGAPELQSSRAPEHPSGIPRGPEACGLYSMGTLVPRNAKPATDPETVQRERKRRGLLVGLGGCTRKNDVVDARHARQTRVGILPA